MNADTPEPPAPATGLPVFTPVPRQRMRRGGWSAERQRQFIELLAETGSVRAACRRLGVGEHHIYKLRGHPEGESFRKAWEAALDLGIARIEDVAMDRALNGVEQPVYSYGKLVGSRTVHNDRLLMFLLRNRAPDRFGDGRAKGPDAIGRMELTRKKKEWRKEWEAERLAAYPEQERAASEAFLARLKTERDGWWSALSPRTRAAYEEYKRLEDEDRANGYLSYADPEHENYVDPNAPMTEEDVGDGSFSSVPDWREAEPPKEPDKPDRPRLRRLKDEGWE